MEEIAKKKCRSLFYLNRYFRFIESRKLRDNDSTHYESHHILPKADDMFPEFRDDPSNIILLTPREHFIAHMMLAKAFGGSQVFAFMQMCNKRLCSKNKRSDVRINSVIYETIKTEYKAILSEMRKKDVLVEDSFGNSFRVLRTDERLVSGELKIKTTGFCSYVLYINDNGDTLQLKFGDPVPEGYKHVNSGKACYISKKDGKKRQLRTDDPLVLSGEYIAESSGRVVKEPVKQKFREIFSDTVNIIFEDGSKLRVKKEDLHLIKQPYRLNHGKGIKRKNKEAYRNSALNRKSGVCKYCAKEVKINLLDRWHNENCKHKPEH